MLINPEEDLQCEICQRELRGRYWRLQIPDLVPQTSTHTAITCVTCYALACKLSRFASIGLFKEVIEAEEIVIKKKR